MLCCSFWGDALIWGFNNKKDSAEACCNACSSYKPTPDKDGMDCNGEAGRQGASCWCQPFPSCCLAAATVASSDGVNCDGGVRQGGAAVCRELLLPAACLPAFPGRRQLP